MPAVADVEPAVLGPDAHVSAHAVEAHSLVVGVDYEVGRGAAAGDGLGHVELGRELGGSGTPGGKEVAVGQVRWGRSRDGHVPCHPTGIERERGVPHVSGDGEGVRPSGALPGALDVAPAVFDAGFAHVVELLHDRAVAEHDVELDPEVALPEKGVGCVPREPHHDACQPGVGHAVELPLLPRSRVDGGKSGAVEVVVSGGGELHGSLRLLISRRVAHGAGF